MINSHKKLVAKPSFRYLIVGGSVYFFEVLVIIIAQHNGASPVIAVAWSYVLGTLMSFMLQKLVTFSDRRMHHRILLPQLVATCLLVLFNFGFTLMVAKIFANIIPAVASRTLALLISTIWNYYLYRTKIFNQPDYGKL